MAPSAKRILPPDKARSNGQESHWCIRKLHTAKEVIPILDDIIQALESAGHEDRETFAVRLALEEALVNAIKHGNKGDSRKMVQLRYQLAPQGFIAEIEDQGEGFRPQELPDPLAAENLERPGGRGLLLMRHYMTWVRYNATGNRVTLCRERWHV